MDWKDDNRMNSEELAEASHLIISRINQKLQKYFPPQQPKPLLTEQPIMPESREVSPPSDGSKLLMELQQLRQRLGKLERSSSAQLLRRNSSGTLKVQPRP